MQPILADTCIVIRNALSSDETARVIHAAETRGFSQTDRDYPPSYRNNDRLVLDDPALAARLFERLADHIPTEVTDAAGDRWVLRGLNERFRFCRYRGGQCFTNHRDGVYYRGDDERSHLTFMVYLNDASEFTGGATRFFDGPGSGARQLESVRPERGSLIVFDHTSWHDGAPVTQGVKYVMRSDIMYRRATSTSRPVDRHSGYVWKLIELADGRIASGSRDKTIRLWQRDGDVLTSTAVLRGHRSSVTALAQSSSGTLWSGSRAGRIRTWALDGTPGPSFHAHGGAVLALARLATGRIASASADGTIKLWSAPGACVASLCGHAGWVWDLAVSGSGDLVSGSEDGTVRLWRAADLELEQTLACGGAPVRAVAALADGRIAAGAADGVLRLFRDGELEAAVDAHAAAVRALTELPGGILATAGEDDAVRLWSGSPLRQLAERTHDDFVTSLLAVDEGLLSASYDATIVYARGPWHSQTTTATTRSASPSWCAPRRSPQTSSSTRRSPASTG